MSFTQFRRERPGAALQLRGSIEKLTGAVIQLGRTAIGGLRTISQLAGTVGSLTHSFMDFIQRRKDFGAGRVGDRLINRRVQALSCGFQQDRRRFTIRVVIVEVQHSLVRILGTDGRHGR